MICDCGLPLEGTCGVVYTVTIYDNEGNLIYAQCQHGYIVVDKLSEEFEGNHPNEGMWEEYHN